MEDVGLSEWVQSQIAVLKDRGLQGPELSKELRRLVWEQKHNDLTDLIGNARTMEEAWGAFAECLEQELAVLLAGLADIGGGQNELEE